MKRCIKCNEIINPKRLEILPNTKTCTKHSEAEKKIGTPIAYGEGDHIYIELNIMEADDYKRIEKLSKTSRNLEFGF